MKDFNTEELWLAFGLAGTGAIVHILGKLVSNSYRSKWGIIYDLLAAFFVGSLTYVACRYFGLETWATGGLTGLAGHGGARLIPLMESWAAKRMGFDLPDEKR